MRTWPTCSGRHSSHHGSSLSDLRRPRDAHMHLLGNSWSRLTWVMWDSHRMALAHSWMLRYPTRMRWIGGALGQTRHHLVKIRRSTTWKSKYLDFIPNMRLEVLSPPPPASRATMSPALSRLVWRSQSTITVSIVSFRSVSKSWGVGS